MLFSELLEQLTYGELANLALSNSGVEIEPCHYARIASYTNAGLAEIYARFNIREEEALIQQYASISTYRLLPQYSLFSGSAEPVKYILDTVDNVFQGNVIQILEVYDEIGEEIVLNDTSNEDSFFTPDFNSLQIITPNSENTISVVYQSAHDKLILTPSSDPTSIVINIPGIMVSALTNFIGSRVLSSMGPEGLAEGNNMYMKYEQVLRNIENYGLFKKDDTSADLITNNGWV